jgi:lipoprotein Spr
MKNQYILLFLLINLTACKVFQPASADSGNSSSARSKHNSGQHISPALIQNISTESGDSAVRTPEASFYGKSSQKTVLTPINNDEFLKLQFKYAILTNSPVEEMTNQRLLVFMDQWYGAPYHYGGTGKDGIDCSAFACLLLASVYNMNQLPRISADQYQATRRISKKDLREGDLVFFHTLGKGHRVTHVGIYLYNNRFVHASVAGVQISDLGEGYYLQHYVGAGRVISE